MKLNVRQWRSGRIGFNLHVPHDLTVDQFIRALAAADIYDEDDLPTSRTAALDKVRSWLRTRGSDALMDVPAWWEEGNEDYEDWMGVEVARRVEKLFPELAPHIVGLSAVEKE